MTGDNAPGLGKVQVRNQKPVNRIPAQGVGPYSLQTKSCLLKRDLEVSKTD